jgi:hypothetical protein
MKTLKWESNRPRGEFHGGESEWMGGYGSTRTIVGFGMPVAPL